MTAYTLTCTAFFACRGQPATAARGAAILAALRAAVRPPGECGLWACDSVGGHAGTPFQSPFLHLVYASRCCSYLACCVSSVEVWLKCGCVDWPNAGVWALGCCARGGDAVCAAGVRAAGAGAAAFGQPVRCGGVPDGVLKEAGSAQRGGGMKENEEDCHRFCTAGAHAGGVVWVKKRSATHRVPASTHTQ
eukprot:360363-Chlamydomonas_euryale.AAC.8